MLPPTAKITANRSQDYRSEPKRLFVVADHIADDYGAGFYDGFKARLGQRIKECGADVELTAVTALDLDAQVHQARLNNFGPDAVLSIRHPKGTIGTKNQYGGVLNMIYDAELVDTASKETVWKASINLDSGGMSLSGPYRSKDYIGEGLANELANQLQKDGIYHACPAAK